MAPGAVIVRTVGGAVPHSEGHDATAYPDLGAARARITRIVAALRPAGNVLEIGCGTAMRTGTSSVQVIAHE